MINRQRLKKKGILVSLVLGLILCLSSPGSATDREQGSEPDQPRSDAFDLATKAFSLALTEQNDKNIISLFTLTNDTLSIPHSILEEMPKKSDRLENSLYTASLLTLTALNVADYISTVRALQLPGLEEGNPIMRPFTKNILLFSTVKLGIAVLDFYLLKKIFKKNKTAGWVLSILGNFAMSYIVSSNIRKIQSVTGK